MKIAIAIRRYTTHGTGGMEHVCATRAAELARQGHEVHIITTGGMGTVVPDTGETVHMTDSPTGVYSDAFAECCRDAVHALVPDILHLESHDDQRPWWANLSIRGLAVSTTSHGFKWAEEMGRWASRMLEGKAEPPSDWAKLRENAAVLHSFDRVVVISRLEAWLAQMMYFLPNARLVYNPIGGHFFDAPVATRERSGYICMASRWPGIAKIACSRAGVELRVVEGVATEGMPALYDGAEALLVPGYHTRGFDLIIAEALARRCPVIAAQVGAVVMESLPGITRVPAVEQTTGFAIALRNSFAGVPPGAAEAFTPAFHVKQWLEAVS